MSPARPATLHVPAEYTSIQAGVDAAASGDTVLVAPGTYTATQSRTIPGGAVYTAVVFLKSGVSVLSESGAGSTTIDMLGASGSNPTAVAAVGLAAGEASLEGFTVTGAPNGYSGLEASINDGAARVRIRDCDFRDLWGGSFRPAGIYCIGTTLDVQGVDFSSIHSQESNVSGIRFNSTSGDSLSVVGCTFHDSSGRALNCQNASSMLLQDSHFLRATSTIGTAAITASFVRVERCHFEDNVTTSSSAIVALQVSGVVGSGSGVDQCVFWKNRRQSGTADAVVRISVPSVPVTGCTFVGNGSSSSGGILVLATSTAGAYVVERNIFDHSSGGYAVRRVGSTGIVTLQCNCFWSNGGLNASGLGIDATNILQDPLFCAAASGDFTVGSSSPCLPEHSNGCGQIGAFGEGCILVTHTVTTNPLLPLVRVDGQAFAPPHSAAWVPGTLHALAVDSIQAVAGDRYVFQHWEDGSMNRQRTVAAPEASTMFTATYFFDPYRMVTVTTIPEASFPIRVDGVQRTSPFQFLAGGGESHILTAITPVSPRVGVRYAFAHWEDGSTALARTVIIPPSDATYTAEYVEDPYDTLTVASAPVQGLTVLVDGSSRTTPYIAFGDSGTAFQLFVPSPQTKPTGVYSFRNWEDGSTNPNRMFTLGNSAAVATAHFDVDSETNATITTIPAGLRITVDGVDYLSPTTLIWEFQSTHTIGAEDSGVVIGEGTRLRFGSWSDGGAIVHTVVASTVDPTYTASFVEQHLLTLEARSGDGSFASPGGWFDEGTSTKILAYPDPRFRFHDWAGSGPGSYSGTNNPASVTLLGPVTEVASFAPVTFEFALSLSATDPNVNAGPPVGTGSIYLWAVCESGSGIQRCEMDFVATGFSALAFSPAPNILNAGSGTHLMLVGVECFPTHGVIGTFYVDDPSGGSLCLNESIIPEGGAFPRLVDCNLGPPLNYVGPGFIRTRGCRTDSGTPCMVGDGCGSLFPEPLASTFRAGPDGPHVTLRWKAVALGGSVEFEIERAASREGPFRPIVSIPALGPTEMAYSDESARPSTSYSYRLRARTKDREEWFGPVEVTTGSDAPSVSALLSPMPNPFHDRVQLAFRSAKRDRVRLSIYDVGGRFVRTLFEGEATPGTISVEWNGTDAGGGRVSAGIYFLRWTIENRSVTKRLVRIE